MEQLLTKREVAELLGVTTRTIEQWRKDRGFPGRRTFADRGIVLFRPSEVEAWLQARTDGHKPSSEFTTRTQHESAAPPATLPRVGRFAPKYSDAQREAVVSAVLDDGMTAAQASRAAKAGDLGTRPFQIPVGTIRDLVGKQRQQRREADLADPFGRVALIESANETLLGIAYGELERLKRQARRGNVDMRKARELARLFRDLRATPVPRKPQRAHGPSKGPDFIDQLARELSRTDKLDRDRGAVRTDRDSACGEDGD